MECDIPLHASLPKTVAHIFLVYGTTELAHQKVLLTPKSFSSRSYLFVSQSSLPCASGDFFNLMFTVILVRAKSSSGRCLMRRKLKRLVCLWLMRLTPSAPDATLHRPMPRDEWSRAWEPSWTVRWFRKWSKRFNNFWGFLCLSAYLVQWWAKSKAIAFKGFLKNRLIWWKAVLAALTLQQQGTKILSHCLTRSTRPFETSVYMCAQTFCSAEQNEHASVP